MRDGLALSGALHVVVIGVLVFGLPSFVDPPAYDVIPVELIVLDEQQPTPRPKPKPEQTAEEVAPEPEPPKQEAKAVPEPIAPEPEPEPPVEEAKPEPEPEPEPPPPEAKPEPEPEAIAEPPPPKPKRRPKVVVAMPDKKKKKDEPEPDRLTSILRNVERLADEPEQPRKETAKAPTPGPVTSRVSVFEQNEMVRAIQSQLRRCWRIDPGARAAEDLVVEIKVLLNPDGSVADVKVVDVVRMVQDGYFRSAAENAKRAINRCSPFELPPRKYNVWRQLTLRFDPREMFGT